jgi:tetratricopeptide (TPR) repeat protein
LKNQYFTFRLFSLLSVIVFCLLSSCSQFSTGPVNVGFHNLTAKYNAYVIARDKMMEAEKTLANNRKDDYNQLMPILQPLDSVKAQLVKPLLDDVIKKGSLIPSLHQNSKWVDNALILIAKARLYKGQFTEAIETLKYTNVKGSDENDKHEALIWLMRAYTETKEYNSSLAVAEYLRSQPLNKSNTRDYYLNKAYLHQQKQEYGLATAILEETFDLMPKNEDKARTYFAAAQMYDLMEKYQLANEKYALVAKNRPNYDLSFYAHLNSLQNESLTDPTVSLENGFDKLLDDRKNNDLKDRLYYAMGVIETRKNNFPKALNYFKKSVQNTTINTSQVPYTYLEMARINYEKLQNYEQAKAYYDSSLAVLPKSSPQYAKVADRKAVLDDFVKQLTVIRTEDSLQRLSQLNPTALDKFLDAKIQRDIDDEAEKQKEAKRLIDMAKAVEAINLTDTQTPQVEQFILYDKLAMNQSKIDFQQKWGRRVLADDWRRSNKTSVLTTLTDNTPVASPQPVINGAANLASMTNEPIKKDSPEWKAKKESLKANIPFRKPEFDASNKKIEDSQYQLGKIYKFGLNEPANSVKTFKELLSRFPATGYKPESYYLLYLTDTQPNKPKWKDVLSTEFPNSPYLRLINNSGGKTDVVGNPELQAIRDYEQLYSLYESGNYTEALARVETEVAGHAGTKVQDKFGFLRILLAGKVNGRDAYLKSVNDFIKEFPNSPLLPRAKELLESQESSARK